MSTNIDALRLRKIMGRSFWCPPYPFGPDGWKMNHQQCYPGTGTPIASIIVTCSDHPPETYEILHASIAYADGVTMPSYQELAMLHHAVFGEGYAYQVFVGGGEHVNIHPTALHLWGRLDGKPMMPSFAMDFGKGLQI